MKIDENAIRERSYFIWVEEGCPEGRDLAHWLQAKAELEAAGVGKATVGTRQRARKRTREMTRKTTSRKSRPGA